MRLTSQRHWPDKNHLRHLPVVERYHPRQHLCVQRTATEEALNELHVVKLVPKTVHAVQLAPVDVVLCHQTRTRTRTLAVSLANDILERQPQLFPQPPHDRLPERLARRQMLRQTQVPLQPANLLLLAPPLEEQLAVARKHPAIDLRVIVGDRGRDA